MLRRKLKYKGHRQGPPRVGNIFSYGCCLHVVINLNVVINLIWPAVRFVDNRVHAAPIDQCPDPATAVRQEREDTEANAASVAVVESVEL